MTLFALGINGKSKKWWVSYEASKQTAIPTIPTIVCESIFIIVADHPSNVLVGSLAVTNGFPSSFPGIPVRLSHKSSYMIKFFVFLWI